MIEVGKTNMFHLFSNICPSFLGSNISKCMSISGMSVAFKNESAIIALFSLPTPAFML